MAEYDLLIRGASPLPAIGISGGCIAGFSPAPARAEIDATGLLVLPGVIDAHVHFNEPGRTEWEGWATGSAAAVAGGVTMVCDMPLNSTPPVITPEAFDAKREAAAARAICDFALWGGLVPGALDAMPALAACGAIGFKAFMASSGIADFPTADFATLREGMRRAAALHLPVAVHAELERPRPRRGLGSGTSAMDYAASRPVESECDAIRAALEIAGETSCPLHIVHISSARGLTLVSEARANGQDVTGETCPHYLVFSADDLLRLGAVAKCAPPLRDDLERAALLDMVRGGLVDTIGSDHSPSPWALKDHADFFDVWGGIAGVQHLLPVLLNTGLGAGLIARLTAEQVARRFGFTTKGRIAIGLDADLSLVELGEPREVTADALLYRHRVSPYVGRPLRARVRATFVRGRMVVRDGHVIADGGGRLVTPAQRR